MALPSATLTVTVLVIWLIYQLAVQAQRRYLSSDDPDHVFSPLFSGTVFLPKQRSVIPPIDMDYPLMLLFYFFFSLAL